MGFGWASVIEVTVPHRGVKSHLCFSSPLFQAGRCSNDLIVKRSCDTKEEGFWAGTSDQERYLHCETRLRREGNEARQSSHHPTLQPPTPVLYGKSFRQPRRTTLNRSHRLLVKILLFSKSSKLLPLVIQRVKLCSWSTFSGLT